MKKFFSIAVLLLVAVLVVGCTSENLAEEKAELIYIGSKDAVNGSFALPKFVQGEAEAPIEWTSSNTESVKIEEFADWDDAFDHSKFIKAVVTLGTEEVDLELTAVVTVGKDKATVKFPVTVVADLYTEKTITEAKAADLGTKVKVSGTVSYVGDSGYIIVAEDKTNQMFVYRGSGVKVGDVVVVRAETAEYQQMPQLSNSAFEKVDQTEFNPDTEAVVMTLTEVNAHPDTDKSFYSKLVKLTGKLVKTTDSNRPFAIENPLDPADFVYINKYTSAKSVETMNANLGKLITVNAVLYDNRGGDFTLLLPDTFPAGTVISYSDEDNAIRMFNALAKTFGGMIITEDVVFPTTDEETGATIAWASSNVEVLANDGTVNTPNDDTTVTLTITVTVNEEVHEGTVEVTVKQLPISKVEDIVALTPDKAADPKVLVAFEGVVVGLQRRGYWVADETGAILIFNYDDPKPEVGQVVKVGGELTTYKDTERFTSQISNSSFTVLDKAAPTVLAATTMTWEQMFGLGVDTYAKADAQGQVYYGKYITITGKVTGSEYYWEIRNPANEDQFFKLDNLASSALLEGKADTIITITVMVRDIYHIDDTSGYNNYFAGTFGGIFFAATANIVVQE